MMESPIQGYLVHGLPVIGEGDDLPALIEARFELQDGDVLCIASTVVAKSEGRFRRLEDYEPSLKATEIASALGKDPRFVQAVLDESSEILLERPFLLVATKFGHIGDNAGIDQSNVGDGRLLLLPENPSASAEGIRKRLSKDCAVIITDTCGRPFRCGVTGVAVGWSGIAALRDWRGKADMHGRALEITLEAIVDEIASAANLLMGEAGDGTPAVVFRGLRYPCSGSTVFMPKEKDVIRPKLKT
ncbi:MAG: coenzyme F420-0:L-glutamate ligase [Methanotrichaceae archaeon]|nr:coenzyme F420-0:L-glutamate ligase [Methanotrichaceae archaeon]